MTTATTKKSAKVAAVQNKNEVATKPEAGKKPEPDVRVLKSAVTPSLSGKSKLTYEVGVTSSNDLRLRIVANSGAGSFRQEWVELRAIRAALDKVPRNETVTSDQLVPLFVRESANMPSFVFAVLLHEGLVRRSVKEKRRYERVEPEAFDAAVQALMEGKGAPRTDAKGGKAKGKKTVTEKTPSASTKNKK
jgi:hypothetical protein